MSRGEPLLVVRDLVHHYRAGTGFLGGGVTVRAVDGVDLEVGRGEIVGLVGESGSGKTTLARAVLRLVEPTAGTVRFDGIDLLSLRPREMRALRRRMQVIFQDPAAALNPLMRVGSLVGEPLAIHGLARGRERRRRVRELLAEVGLDPSLADRRPGELSGGQRQRVMIARALAVRPEFVVCDEPVASLDVSIQAQVINLLVELQRRHGIAYLFIAHDLALVGHLCDRVVVMYLGKVVETGPAGDLLGEPGHPYTRALLAAVPLPDPALARGRTVPLPGELPSPVDVPPGCRFHPRCPFAEERCRREEPALVPRGPGRSVACHLADRLPPPDVSLPRPALPDAGGPGGESRP